MISERFGCFVWSFCISHSAGGSRGIRNDLLSWPVGGMGSCLLQRLVVWMVEFGWFTSIGIKRVSGYPKGIVAVISGQCGNLKKY